MKKYLFIIIGLVSLNMIMTGYPLWAEIIPPDRRIDWSPASVGVPGGIPNRQTVFASVTAYGAIGDDSTDNRAAFQAAFNACPSGQVVTIPAGVFRINGTLSIPSNITIRGAGPSTVIKSVGAVTHLFYFGANAIPWGLTQLANVTTNIASGATGGSTQIVVENASGISAGMLLVISELNNPAFVTQVGAGGTANNVSGWGDNGARARGEIVEVTSVNGTTIGFAPALTSDYTRTPWATRFTAQCQWSGVENLKTYATNSGTMRNFYFLSAAYCWVKDVECDYTDGDHPIFDFSFRCEVRGSYFHDAYIHLPGQHDNAICLRYKTSRCLIVDNIFRRLHLGVCTEWGACGNVIAYNYFLESFDERYGTTGQQVLMACISINHGAHPQFNLIEGNVCNKIEPDNYWGSSSHNTIYRNHITGHGYANPPFTGRGDPDTGTVVQWMQQPWALNIWDGQTFYNIIGNVLGDDFSVSHNAVRKVVHPDYRGYQTYCLFSYGYTGYSDTGTGTPVNPPVPSMNEHGNWDAVSGDVEWDPANSDHDLPASFCFASKPDWFGNVPWPPIGPDVPGQVNKIPAQLRYEQMYGPRALIVISPNGGETWVRGFSRNITWNSSGVTDPVRIELFKAGVLNQVIAENQAIADGSHAWSIPADQTTGNDYTVKLTAGTYSDTSGVFTIAAPSAPVVQTLAAQSITASSASLRGTVHSMGSGTSYYFQYGLTLAYGSETAADALAANADQTTVQAALSGLDASTTYHFRLVANNSAGTTEGNDLTFTTSGGGGGGGSGDSGGGGGGGGGCFIATAGQSLNLWLMVFGLVLGWLVCKRIAKRRKNMIKSLVILTGICFLSGAVSAEIISNDRRINWSPGIPGGIPNYPVGVNVKDYGAVGDNTSDDTIAIQNAINACPAGQAVYLPEGVYRTTARLNVNKGIVIRGEGPSKSKILSDSDDAIILYLGAGGGPTGAAINVISGYAKDSSTIVAADTSSFSAGDYVGIYQDNEPGLVYPQGYSTTCTWCGFGGNYLTCMAQIARITNKNGNELTLSQPLYYGFQASLNPKIQKISMIQGVGLEDICIEKARNEGASSTGNITAFGLAYSWIKNVHSRMCLGAHVRMSYSYGCVIRDSFFDDAFWRTGSRSYGIFLIFSNSANLIENNVLYRVTPAMCMEGGGSGNVFGYNFTKDSFHDNDPTWFIGASAITHGAHPYMNLFEGNRLEGLHFDNTWGSSSHNTCFRNHIIRACGQAIYGVKAVDVHEHNYYHNFVANVLGLVGQTGTWGPSQCDVNNVMWRLGCLSSGAGGNPSDQDVTVRTLRHGNFSMIANETEWDPDISGRTFPDSYYLTSKPAWFGNILWPAIGPDVNGLANKIPAQVRFESLPAINSFTANPAVIAQGQSGALSWTVTGADSLSINQGIGTVSGTSTTVSPAATTTYTLTATNSTGSSTAAVTVTVQSGSGGGDAGSGGGGGGGCLIATVAHGSVQWSGLLPLFLFLLGIGLVGWSFGKRKTL
jgi:hypothetical protein